VKNETTRSSTPTVNGPRSPAHGVKGAEVKIISLTVLFAFAIFVGEVMVR
jgi:hypothetical protein